MSEEEKDTSISTKTDKPSDPVPRQTIKAFWIPSVRWTVLVSIGGIASEAAWLASVEFEIWKAHLGFHGDSPRLYWKCYYARRHRASTKLSWKILILNQTRQSENPCLPGNSLHNGHFFPNRVTANAATCVGLEMLLLRKEKKAFFRQQLVASGDHYPPPSVFPDGLLVNSTL